MCAAVVGTASPARADAPDLGGEPPAGGGGAVASTAPVKQAPLQTFGPGPPPAPAPAPAPNLDGDDTSMTFRAADMDSFSQQTAKDAVALGSFHARYTLNVFGDVGAGIVGGDHGYATKPSFGINNFSLLFTGDLENSIRFVSELSVEPNEANAIGIDLERLSMRWKASNGFWIEAGRTHTDIGYWNNAYHHGTWLQPTIARPRAVRFEDSGGLLPVHWVGAAVGWLVSLGEEKSLRASVAAGNGRGFQEDDLQLKFDTNVAKQMYAQVEVKGLGLRDLRAGLSGVYGEISADARRVDPESLHEMIGGVHVAYPGAQVTFLAEAYAINHQGAQRSWQTYAAYALAGYTIRAFTPFVMVERVEMRGGLDPFYVVDPSKPHEIDGVEAPQLTNMTGFRVADAVAGVRWDVSTWSAVKVEYRLAHFYDTGLTAHTGYAAWQFGL